MAKHPAIIRQKVERYKRVTCRTCGKLIKRYDRTKFPNHHVPAGVILQDIRRHYKRHHPGAFRESIKKALRTKRGKR